VYIHDYLLKRKLHNSAKAFMAEGKVATDPVGKILFFLLQVFPNNQKKHHRVSWILELAAIDAPGGFLFEWWSVFWDIFIARTNEKHSEPAAAYIEVPSLFLIIYTVSALVLPTVLNLYSPVLALQICLVLVTSER